MNSSKLWSTYTWVNYVINNNSNELYLHGHNRELQHCKSTITKSKSTNNIKHSIINCLAFLNILLTFLNILLKMSSLVDEYFGYWDWWWISSSILRPQTGQTLSHLEIFSYLPVSILRLSLLILSFTSVFLLGFFLVT